MKTVLVSSMISILFLALSHLAGGIPIVLKWNKFSDFNDATTIRFSIRD